MSSRSGQLGHQRIDHLNLVVIDSVTEVIVKSVGHVATETLENPRRLANPLSRDVGVVVACAGIQPPPPETASNHRNCTRHLPYFDS